MKNLGRKDLIYGTLGILLIALVPSLVIISCSEQYPTATYNESAKRSLVEYELFDPISSKPDSTETDPLTLGTRPPDLLADSVTLDEADTMIVEDADSLYIGAEFGGTIELDSLPGHNALEIPAKALTETTKIKVAVLRPVTKDGARDDRVRVQFGPNGLVLNEPAILVLDRQLFALPHLGPPSKLRWEYLDPTTKTWLYQFDVAVSPDNTFRIPVAHFSEFRATVIAYDGLSQGGQ